MPPKDPPKPFTAPLQPKPPVAAAPQPAPIKPVTPPPEPPKPKESAPAVKPFVAPPPPPPPAPVVKPRPVIAKYNGLDPALEERLYTAVGKPANDEDFAYPNGAASKVRVLRWFPKDAAEQASIYAILVAFTGVEAATE